MNEAETRAELIDPRLKDAGWGDVDGKDYFTIYDPVDAYHHFADPEYIAKQVRFSTLKSANTGGSPCPF